ncbi:MAG: type I-U CRISPR-associated RAMP protein Csb1/Cas7u [Acidobacteriota bacterium]
MTEPDRNQDQLRQALSPDGPACAVIKARFTPVGELGRFQPAGFPEIGHVIYDRPRKDGGTEKVCIVDSAASMANHLEAICVASPTELHEALHGLPYVVCVTDSDGSPSPDRVVTTSLSEGHRIASDYFLDARPLCNGQPDQEKLRERLRREFGIIEVKKDKTYFIPPETWWSIYKTIFKYDPNSLVHGVMFAREQIKISRLLTGHFEAHGAARVGRSGVKFDRLGKTTSGQPIFSVDEETAHEIRATFVLDLALLRSYGRGDNGLGEKHKKLLLDLSLWKVSQLAASPFRFRSGCHLQCEGLEWSTDIHPSAHLVLPTVDIADSIRQCAFAEGPVTRVYYPAKELFTPPREEGSGEDREEAGDEDEDSEG